MRKRILSIGLLVALVSVAPLVWRAKAQTPAAPPAGIGVTYAASLGGCMANNTYTLCIYGTSAAPGVAVSVAGGLFTQVQGAPGPQGPAGPAGPPGPAQSFNTNSCNTWSGGSTGIKMTGCTQSTP